MAAEGWLQVRASKTTEDDAEQVAADLSSDGAVKFTRAQVLSAGLAHGVQAIKSDRSLMLPSGTRRKKHSPA